MIEAFGHGSCFFSPQQPASRHRDDDHWRRLHDGTIIGAQLVCQTPQTGTGIIRARPLYGRLLFQFDYSTLGEETSVGKSQQEMHAPRLMSYPPWPEPKPSTLSWLVAGVLMSHHGGLSISYPQVYFPVRAARQNFPRTETNSAMDQAER